MPEEIIETKVCKHCNLSFEITDKDLEFYEKVSPVFPQNGELSSKNGEIRKLIKPLSSKFSALNSFKYLIPAPTLCPDCRQQRRLCWRNEICLYRRKSSFTGEEIVSMYSPDKELNVVENEIWRSDKIDGTDYFLDFDFNRGLFDQIDDLLKKVPLRTLNVSNTCENCFANQIHNCKNCYLISASTENENCYYGRRFISSKNCVDGYIVNNCSNCYSGIDLYNCNNCFYSQDLYDCSYCYFVSHSKGCDNCFLSINLFNKSYCILNKQYEKNDYIKEKESLLRKGSDFLKSKFKKFSMIQIHKNLNITNSENILGDNVSDSKNGKYIFDSAGIEDGSFLMITNDSKNIYDCNYMCCESELGYEISTGGVNTYKCAFGVDVWPGTQHLYYCILTPGCNNCFGCVGLKNKSYCILNKQYEKSEYEKLVPKIIEHIIKLGEWGEFFPSSLSPFGYNETVAQEYFPITPPLIPPLQGEGSKMFQFSLSPRRGKISEGQIGVFNWSDYEGPKPKVDKVIPASKLPRNIKDIPDDILNWAIECEITGKPFRIIKEELDFYRKHNLPIPKRHPDQRHLDRMKLRNPRKLYDRKCDKCGVDIKTTYSPKRPEIVYCENCYRKEVY